MAVCQCWDMNTQPLTLQEVPNVSTFRRALLTKHPLCYGYFFVNTKKHRVVSLNFNSGFGYLSCIMFSHCFLLKCTAGLRQPLEPTIKMISILSSFYLHYLFKGYLKIFNMNRDFLDITLAIKCSSTCMQ